MTKIGKVPVEVTPPAIDHRDAEALRRVAAGETSALAGLYERHHVSVQRFVAHATNHAHDVEDLVHATFLTAARAAAAFDGRESCRPWLLGIAGRLLQRRRRALARWSRAMRALAVRDAVDHVDPHRRLWARDELSALPEALALMSDSRRIVLLLSELEGLTSEQIAFGLRIPIGTVASRLHHARRELRSRLARFKGGER